MVVDFGTDICPDLVFHHPPICQFDTPADSLSMTPSSPPLVPTALVAFNRTIESVAVLGSLLIEIPTRDVRRSLSWRGIPLKKSYRPVTPLHERPDTPPGYIPSELGSLAFLGHPYPNNNLSGRIPSATLVVIGDIVMRQRKLALMIA